MRFLLYIHDRYVYKSMIQILKTCWCSTNTINLYAYHRVAYAQKRCENIKHPDRTRRTVFCDSVQLGEANRNAQTWHMAARYTTHINDSHVHSSCTKRHSINSVFIANTQPQHKLSIGMQTHNINQSIYTSFCLSFVSVVLKTGKMYVVTQKS